MTEAKDSCVEPAKGPIDMPKEESSEAAPSSKQVAFNMLARVGKTAPDFEAAAFVDGGFRNIKLSDYRGQWVALCFYPGDFTFV